MKFLKRSRGFTMAEMLATIGLVGILGAISMTLFIGTQESAKTQRLLSDVASLNRAVTTYRAHGGNLATNLTAHQVLSKLKTTGDAETRRTLPGYRGSFIDGRFAAVDVSASTPGPRAVWDATELEFTVADGIDGVRFKMLGANTADAGIEETRGVQGPGFAKTSSWVWDFSESASTSLASTTAVVTNDADPTLSPNYVSPLQLGAPIFSIPGGSYPPADYPLSLTLTNPPQNPLNTPIRYSLNNAPWQVYDGTPLVISSETQIVAYADRNGSNQIYSSYTVTELYRAEASTLSFSGQSSGQFLNAEGGPNMVANYVENGLNGNFEWGRGVEGFTTGSQLSFYSAEFLDVEEQTWFRLGGLEYFNSTISLNTQATNVQLDLSIAFRTPNVTETFAFNFALENTRNHHLNTMDQNADYVRVTNPNSAFSTSLNGQQYDLQLQFGYLGSDGFATVDEFHVHEGSSATADIWGYFAPTPEAND